MRIIFILLFFITFSSFWGYLFIKESESKNSFKCNDLSTLTLNYFNQIHKDIDQKSKETIFNMYEQSNLLKIKECKSLDNINIISIGAYEDSYIYKLNKFFYDIVGDKNDLIKKSIFSDYKPYQHIFYYSTSQDVIIELFYNLVRDIHINKDKGYLNIKFLSDIENSPLYLFNQQTYKKDKSFLNMKFFINNSNNDKKEFIFKKIINNNYDRKIEEREGTLESEDKIYLIKSITVEKPEDQFLFLKYFIYNNFEIEIENEIEFMKNNLNTNFDFPEGNFKIDIYYDNDNKFFNVLFSNI